MPDRGKVLLALKQHLIVNDGEECEYCPYGDLYKIDCVRQLYQDAVELLKEQEPRVLTWDELMALPHGEETNAPVVIEEKYPVETWDKGTQCKWAGARFAQEMAQDHFWHNQDTYNKIWRVWTALPSKKQRKAVKWE